VQNIQHPDETNKNLFSTERVKSEKNVKYVFSNSGSTSDRGVVYTVRFRRKRNEI